MPVLNNYQLCHSWAHREHKSARNQGRTLFHEDGVIYSYGYHFPIARLVDGVVLMTTENYSVTTSHHISMVRRAIPWNILVFNVPEVTADCNHRRNHDDYKVRIDETLKKAAKARSNRDYYITAAAHVVDQANAYSDHFKLRRKKIELDFDIDSVKENIRAEKKRQEKKAAAAEKKRQREQAEVLKLWQSGESNRRPSTSKVFMRVAGDNVETSHGVKFPVSDALKLWPIINKVIKSGSSLTTIPDRFKLGIYSVDAISTKGTVVAGCHTVLFDQIEFVAEQLGVK